MLEISNTITMYQSSDSTSFSKRIEVVGYLACNENQIYILDSADVELYLINQKGESVNSRWGEFKKILIDISDLEMYIRNQVPLYAGGYAQSSIFHKAFLDGELTKGKDSPCITKIYSLSVTANKKEEYTVIEFSPEIAVERNKRKELAGSIKEDTKKASDEIFK